MPDERSAEIPIGRAAARLLTLVLPGLGQIGRGRPGTGLAFALGAIALAAGAGAEHLRGRGGVLPFAAAYAGWLLFSFLHLTAVDRRRDPALQAKRLRDAWAWGVRREWMQMDRLLERALRDDPAWIPAVVARIWCARQAGEFRDAERMVALVRRLPAAQEWSGEIDALDGELRGIRETML